MSKRTDGKSIDVVAAGVRTKDVPVVEEGFIGFPMTDAASGETYALNVEEAVFEFSVASGVAAAKGALLYMSAANAITATNTDRAFVRVVKAKDGNNVVWGKLLPQG